MPAGLGYRLNHLPDLTPATREEVSQLDRSRWGKERLNFESEARNILLGQFGSGDHLRPELSKYEL